LRPAFWVIFSGLFASLLTLRVVHAPVTSAAAMRAEDEPKTGGARSALG
jgi:hypothetical protein